MSNLGFRVEFAPYGNDCEMPWMIQDSGRRRRATPEEVVMWRALHAQAAPVVHAVPVSADEDKKPVRAKR